MKEIKVGIYGGTFDPIHFGHLNLAIQILEIQKLDEVWFCPTSLSPHKLDSPPTIAQDRLRMLELALNDIPQFKILDLEIQREGPSYTIDTLRTLIHTEQQKDSLRKFFLILGEDAFPGFLYWRQPLDIVKLVPLLIGRRNCQVSSRGFINNIEIKQAFEKGLTQTKVMEISASEIRERIRKGLYIGHLVPGKVVDFICKHRLYL